MIREENMYTSVEMTKSERYLHTPGRFAKQNLLYVQEAGHLKSLQPHKCVREKLDSFLLLIVLEGKGTLKIGGKEITVCQGDCAWIDCMEHYEHISDEQEAWRLAWIHFNGKTARPFYELFIKVNDSKATFHVDDVDIWFDDIKNIMACQQEKNILSELICGEQLIHLVNKAIKCVTSLVGFREKDKTLAVTEIRNFINKQYVEKNVLELITNEFGETLFDIGNMFKKAYGISLEEYISNRRYNAAKELLRFTVKSMETVAMESGIGDLILMQQFFIENEGMSAEEYRQKWAGWIRG